MKKIVVFIILAAIFFSIKYYILPEKKKAKDNIHYTALGDSIAEGLNAAENHGYTYMLYQYYLGLFKTVDYANAAKSGDTSSDLLNKLKSSEDVIDSVKKADIITICIGGNDILIGFDKLLNGDLDGLNNAISAFFSNWENINKTIKELNPNAEIYVMDLYNPINVNEYYLGIKCDQDLWDIIDSNIRNLNAVITSANSQMKYKYKVANVYQAYNDYSKEGNLTKIKENSDPHPTDEGHDLIFKQHLLVIPKDK